MDEVFGQPDAFASDKLNAGLGRIYRSWKKTRAAIDPDFDKKRYEHEDAGGD